MGYLESCKDCGAVFEERGFGRGPKREYCDACIEVRRALGYLDRTMQRLGSRYDEASRRRFRTRMMTIMNRWIPLPQQRDKKGRFV